MNDNVLAILEEASASYQDIYEITYINKCMQKKVFHIFDVEFSDKQGEHTSRCIKAYSLEFSKNIRMKATDSKKDYGNEKKFADVDIWVLSSIVHF